MFTPAICPCSACSVRTGFSFWIDFASRTLTAPVSSFFRCVPYPIITISSNTFASTANAIEKFSTLFTAISWVSKPMYEITKVADLSTFNSWKTPSKSVVVPLLVPLTITVAPGNGTPVSASVMVPLISCASVMVVVKSTTNEFISRLFIIVRFCSNVIQQNCMITKNIYTKSIQCKKKGVKLSKSQRKDILCKILVVLEVHFFA